MKKKLIDAIKAKFVGIDDNTAKRLAERAIAKSENGISTDDEVTVAVEAITLADVLKSVNDFSADEAVKRYEEKYNLEKGEKKSDPNNPDPNKDKDKDKDKDADKDKDKADPDKDKDAMAAMKALFKELSDGLNAKLEAVNTELTAIKTGKVSESRKAKLDAIIKDLKDFQKKPYARIELTKMSDDEFEAFLTEVKEEVGDIVAENKASESRVSPLVGGRRQEENKGNTKEATKEEIDALAGKFGLQ